MNTIILAAGMGTRMLPYTNNIPKCMVPLGEKSLLQWQLDVLRGSGADQNIVVVGGYKAEAINEPDTVLIVNQDYAACNMVETLFCAREHMIRDQDLLICYGDIVYEPKVLEALLGSTAPIGITADRAWEKLWRLRMENPLDDAETFVTDENGFVQELGKKPTSHDEIEAQYMGLIYVRADCVGRFVDEYDKMNRDALYDGRDFRNMFMTSFLQYLIDQSWSIEPRYVENGWLEMDTSEEIELYQSMYASGALAEYCDLAKIKS